MTAPDNQSWNRKVLLDLIKDGGLLAGAVIALAGFFKTAWEKLEGVRLAVALFMLLAAASLAGLGRRLRARGRAEGDRTAREELARAALNRSPSAYLYAEPYVDLSRKHGVTLHRGGHSADGRVSVRIGIRLNNFSGHHIKVREITNIAVYFDGLPIHHDDGMRLVKAGNVGAGTRHVHIHEIEATDLLCSLGSTEPVLVTVTATLLLEGPWEERESRAHVFNGDLFVPVKVAYTPAMWDAVEALRAELVERGVDLMDADLRYDGKWYWDVSANPRLRTRVRTEDDSPEEARRKVVLRDVAKRTAEAVYREAIKQGHTQPMRISAVHGGEAGAIAAEQAVEDEPTTGASRGQGGPARAEGARG